MLELDPASVVQPYEVERSKYRICRSDEPVRMYGNEKSTDASLSTIPSLVSVIETEQNEKRRTHPRA